MGTAARDHQLSFWKLHNGGHFSTSDEKIKKSQLAIVTLCLWKRLTCLKVQKHGSAWTWCVFRGDRPKMGLLSIIPRCFTCKGCTAFGLWAVVRREKELSSCVWHMRSEHSFDIVCSGRTCHAVKFCAWKKWAQNGPWASFFECRVCNQNALFLFSFEIQWSCSGQNFFGPTMCRCFDKRACTWQIWVCSRASFWFTVCTMFWWALCACCWLLLLIFVLVTHMLKRECQGCWCHHDVPILWVILWFPLGCFSLCICGAPCLCLKESFACLHHPQWLVQLLCLISLAILCARRRRFWVFILLPASLLAFDKEVKERDARCVELDADSASWINWAAETASTATPAVLSPAPTLPEINAQLDALTMMLCSSTATKKTAKPKAQQQQQHCCSQWSISNACVRFWLINAIFWPKPRHQNCAPKIKPPWPQMKRHNHAHLCSSNVCWGNAMTRWQWRVFWGLKVSQAEDTPTTRRMMMTGTRIISLALLLNPWPPHIPTLIECKPCNSLFVLEHLPMSSWAVGMNLQGSIGFDTAQSVASLLSHFPSGSHSESSVQMMSLCQNDTSAMPESVSQLTHSDNCQHINSSLHSFHNDTWMLLNVNCSLTDKPADGLHLTELLLGKGNMVRWFAGVVNIGHASCCKWLFHKKDRFTHTLICCLPGSWHCMSFIMFQHQSCQSLAQRLSLCWRQALSSLWRSVQCHWQSLAMSTGHTTTKQQTTKRGKESAMLTTIIGDPKTISCDHAWQVLLPGNLCWLHENEVSCHFFDSDLLRACMSQCFMTCWTLVWWWHWLRNNLCPASVSLQVCHVIIIATTHKCQKRAAAQSPWCWIAFKTSFTLLQMDHCQLCNRWTALAMTLSVQLLKAELIILEHCGGSKGRAGSIAAALLLHFGSNGVCHHLQLENSGNNNGGGDGAAAWSLHCRPPFMTLDEAIQLIHTRCPGSLEMVRQEECVCQCAQHLQWPVVTEEAIFNEATFTGQNNRSSLAVKIVPLCVPSCAILMDIPGLANWQLQWVLHECTLLDEAHLFTPIKTNWACQDFAGQWSALVANGQLGGIVVNCSGKICFFDAASVCPFCDATHGCWSSCHWHSHFQIWLGSFFPLHTVAAASADKFATCSVISFVQQEQEASHAAAFDGWKHDGARFNSRSRMHSCWLNVHGMTARIRTCAMTFSGGWWWCCCFICCWFEIKLASDHWGTANDPKEGETRKTTVDDDVSFLHNEIAWSQLSGQSNQQEHARDQNGRRIHHLTKDDNCNQLHLNVQQWPQPSIASFWCKVHWTEKFRSWRHANHTACKKGASSVICMWNTMTEMTVPQLFYSVGETWFPLVQSETNCQLALTESLWLAWVVAASAAVDGNDC